MTDDFRTHRLSKTRTRRPKAPEFPVETITVNRGVLRAALKIANGDASRLQIVSATTVIVKE